MDPRIDAVGLRRELTDMKALLVSSLEPLRSQAAEDGIELRVEALGDVPPAEIDRDKIAWAVATLVGNALRYVEHGTDEEQGGSVLVHLHHDARRRETSVSVQDDGPGVPPDKLPHLFERKPGALHAEGLGLSLVREIVTAHGGRIDVESRSGEEEHGTSVTIVLPNPSTA
jgi:signal transduction histidine kinase